MFNACQKTDKPECIQELLLWKEKSWSKRSSATYQSHCYYKVNFTKIWCNTFLNNIAGGIRFVAVNNINKFMSDKKGPGHVGLSAIILGFEWRKIEFEKCELVGIDNVRHGRICLVRLGGGASRQAHNLLSLDGALARCECVNLISTVGDEYRIYT